MAALGLALAAILALIVRAKGSIRGARKQRLVDAKARLDAGIESINAKRAAVESALAHEKMAEEARKAGKERRALEEAETLPPDAGGSKRSMDRELDKG